MARVLVNDFSPQPDRLTGITVYTWKTLAALLTHGKHRYVLATNRSLSSIPSDIADRVDDIVLRKVSVNDTRAVIENTIELTSIYRRLECGAIFHPQPITMFANLKRSAVVIHDLYRVTHPQFYDWKRRVQWNAVIARGIKGARQVISVSNATRDALLKAYPEIQSRLTVIPEASPIELDDLRSVCQTSPVSGAYGLVVANVEKNKNVDLIVGALKILSARGIRPKIVLVGRDEIGVLPKLLGSGENIDFLHLGSVSDSDLRSLYLNARVYINTSFVEGFCLPILEAQTCGVPVICSDLPVLHEVAGDGAIFVSPHDPDHLATAIERVMLDDAVATSLRDRGTINATRFSWRDTALMTEIVLDKIVAH